MDELVVVDYFHPINNLMLRGLWRMGYDDNQVGEISLDILPPTKAEEEWGYHYAGLVYLN